MLTCFCPASPCSFHCSCDHPRLDVYSVFGRCAWSIMHSSCASVCVWAGFVSWHWVYDYRLHVDTCSRSCSMSGVSQWCFSPIQFNSFFAQTPCRQYCLKWSGSFKCSEIRFDECLHSWDHVFLGSTSKGVLADGQAPGLLFEIRVNEYGSRRSDESNSYASVLVFAQCFADNIVS